VNHMVERKNWESTTSYLQTAGFMPPVKMTAYGKATPATWPSTRRRTSRKGPPPFAAPGGRYSRYSSAVLKYLREESIRLPDMHSSALTQNSSAPLPDA
jgi:hypothetical protein